MSMCELQVQSLALYNEITSQVMKNIEPKKRFFSAQMKISN